MAKVVGIDPSLTGTGVALLGYPGKPLVTKRLAVKKTGAARLIELREIIRGLVKDADLVVIEGYAYAASNSAHQVGEWGGVLRVLLYESTVRWIEAAPVQIKKFATGKHQVKKSEMAIPVYKRWHVEFDSDDERDAFVAAQVGLAVLNDEAGVEQRLTKEQQEVIRAVRYGKGGK